MFWRRRKEDGDAAAADGEGMDDVAKLQRQFGIKPVSDADVQAEFQSLFGGGAGASGADSPTAELLRIIAGGGDEDEEAKIMRELRLGGGDSVDIDGVDVGSSDGSEAGEHGDVHAIVTAAQHNHDKQAIAMQRGDVSEFAKSLEVHPEQKTSGPLATDSAKKVLALKAKALELKRSGNIPLALETLREAKQMEARMAQQPAQVLVTSGVSRSSEPGVREGGAGSLPRPSPPHASDGRRIEDAKSFENEHQYADFDEPDVEVTDDDMCDPEFLAQLAGFGHVDGSLTTDENVSSYANDTASELAALESEIQVCRDRALQYKRQNQISDALACMRKMKELESQRATLQETLVKQTQPMAPPGISASVVRADDKVADSVVSSVRMVTHSYVLATATLPEEQENAESDNSDIEITEEDMNDPMFQDELAKLGFNDSAADTSEESAVNSTQTSVEPVRRASQWRVPLHHQGESIDDSHLIDEFEDDEDEDDADEDKQEPPAGSGQPPIVAQSEHLPTAAALDQMPPSSPVDGASTLADLEQQLLRARQLALQNKRSGRLEDALDSMRRAKQIENLIRLKHANGMSGSKVAPPQMTSDPMFVTKFQELEQLLVDFGNRAATFAKENLASDRAASAEWLSKRKGYAEQLTTLRAKRQNPLQPPPTYTVTKTSRQVEVEMAHIPEDRIQVSIKAINGLQQAAGKEVFVKFSLNFPSNAPHEAQTDPLKIAQAAPYSSGPIAPAKVYQFKLQRSRGTLRLFEIKRAVFEVWRPGTFFSNPELIARGYHELSPLLARCEINARVPFVGANRRPMGGDIEVMIQMRTPLRDKEFWTTTAEELIVGNYPEPLNQSNGSVSAITTQLDTSAQVPKEPKEPKEPSPASEVEVTDPHHLDLIVSYDVINEELEKIEQKLPSLSGNMALETRDRLDSLALKKQILEIEMQTGKLTLDMYTARLRARIDGDRQLVASLMRDKRRQDAARVLHRVKVMEKELEGADGADGDAE